jgi:hypothetical protein
MEMVMSSEHIPATQRTRPLSMEIEHIKQIYDYTKFHIGLYFTFLAGLIAFVNFGRGEHFGEQHRGALLAIIFILLVGGVAGALVASRIVYGPWQKDSFAIERSKFWRKRPLKKRDSRFYWSWADVSLIIEHYAFWLALSIAIVTFTW